MRCDLFQQYFQAHVPGGKRVLYALVGLVLMTCFVWPAYAGLFTVTERDEIAIGRQAAAQVEQKAPMLKDVRIQAYISRLGLALARVSARPHLPWRFRVIDDPHINAFALPGGFVYVHSKVLELARTEAELASVIAHEIGHVDGFHHKAKIERAMRYQLGLGVLSAIVGQGRGADYALIAGRLLAQGQLTRYSRAAEADADRRGVLLLYRAGYNPLAMSVFLENLVRLEKRQSGLLSSFFADHPDAASRVAITRRQAMSLPARRWHADSIDFRRLILNFPVTGGAEEGALIHPGAGSRRSGGWAPRLPTQEGVLIRP